MARKSRRESKAGQSGLRKRRWLRRIVRAVAALGFLLVLALFLLKQTILERFVRPLAIAEISAWSGLDVEIDRIEVEWAGTARILGIRLGGGSPVSSLASLGAASVEVRLRPFAGILGRSPLVERVRVEKPHVVFDLARSPLIPPLTSGEEAETEVEAAGAVELPEILLSGGEVRAEDGDGYVELAGIEARLSEGRIELEVARGGAWWDGPGHDLVEFPLRASASLRGGDASPFSRIAVERISDRGGPLLERVEVEIPEEEGDVVVRGVGPRWGLFAEEVRIGEREVSVSARIEEAGVPELLALVLANSPDSPASPVEDGLLSARVELTVPLEEADAWTATGYALVDRLSLDVPEGASGGVGELFVSFSRRATGHLLGELRMEDAEPMVGSPPCGLETGFALSPGIEEGEQVLEVSAGELRAGDVFAALDGTIRLTAGGEPIVDRVSLQLDEASVADLLALAGAAGGEGGPPFGGCVSVDARLGGTMDPETWRGEVRLGASVRLPGADFPVDAACRIRIGGGEIRLDELLARQGADWVDVSGRLRGPQPWTAEDVRVVGEWGGELVGIDDLSLASDPAGAIEVAGARVFLLGSQMELFARSAPAAGRHELRLDLLDLPLAADRFPRVGLELPPDLVRSRASGMLSTSFALTVAPDASGSSVPEADVWVRLQEGRADFGTLGIRELGATLHARAGEDEIEIVSLEAERQGARVSGSGRVPARWDPVPRPEASSVATLELRGAVDQVAELLSATGEGTLRELTGRASGSVRIRLPFDESGRPERPSVGGSLVLREGLLRLRGELPAIRGVRGRFDIREDGVEISSLSATWSGSELSLGGRVDVGFPWRGGDPGVRSVDVRIQAERALLLAQPDLRVRGDIDLRWKGPWARTRFTGSIDIRRAYYLQDVSIASGGVRLPFDLFHIQQEPLRSARLSVDIRSAKGITLINNVVNAKASAALKLRGTGLDPFVTGTIFTDEGLVKIGNSTLPVRNALIEFKESAPFNPEIDAILSRRIRDYQLTVTVDGTLEEPEIIMQSSPPLNQQELFLLVTTGKTSEDIDRVGSGSFAAAQAAQYVGTSILGYFTRGSDPTEKSFWERFRLETETAKKRTLDDLIRVEYQIYDFEEFLDRNEIFVQSERDFYGDYNMNLGWRFEIE